MTSKDKADKLYEWSGYEGTELGESWDILNRILKYSYCYTDAFILETKLEVEIQYQNALDMIEDGELEIE